MFNEKWIVTIKMLYDDLTFQFEKHTDAINFAKAAVNSLTIRDQHEGEVEIKWKHVWKNAPASEPEKEEETEDETQD